jgi:hypothetical protein
MKENIAESLTVTTGWENSLSLAIGNINEFKKNFHTMCSQFVKTYKTAKKAIDAKDFIRTSLKQLVLSKTEIETLNTKV